MFYPLLKTISPGGALVPVVKMISQEKMDRYGEVTGNGGIIHIDAEYCKERYPHGKTYAHGQLMLAYMSELMELNFGLPWFTSGVMDVKYIGAAHPGDTVVVGGEVRETNNLPDGLQVVCGCAITKQDGGKTTVGTCSVLLPVQ